LKNITLLKYILVLLSKSKIIINQFLSNLLIPYIYYYINKFDINDKKKSNYIWFIYSSKYQYDLINCFFYSKYKINLHKKIKYDKQIYKLIKLEIFDKGKKNMYRYQAINFQKLKNHLFKRKLILPNKIYLGSVSPFLFNDLFTYTFFRILKNKNILNFIDDGISGNIDNNRNYNLNFCPKKDNIITWDFKNYFQEKIKRENKINFSKYLKIINTEALKESNLINSKKYKLIISSKYLDYDYLKDQLLISNKFNKDLFLYIPHNKKWKNSDYLIKNCKLINTKNIEAWILKNSKYIEEIYIGVSATSLIIGELKLLKRINSNINLCISNKTNPNNSKKEFFSFLKSAIKSACYSNIYLNGKISKQI